MELDLWIRNRDGGQQRTIRRWVPPPFLGREALLVTPYEGVEQELVGPVGLGTMLRPEPNQYDLGSKIIRS